jgi:phosphoglycolate phosphatase-like HAD superfamily hydrolase
MIYIFDFDGVIANTFEPYVEFICQNFFLSRERAVKLIMSHTYKNDVPKMYEKMLEMFNMKKLERFLNDKPNIIFTDRMDEILKIEGKKYILTRNNAQFVKDILVDFEGVFEEVIGFGEAQNKMIGFGIIRDEFGVDLTKSVFVTDTVGDIVEAKTLLDTKQIYAANWGYNSVEELAGVIESEQIVSDLKRLLVEHV